MALNTTCHCGNITVTAPNMPDWINDCQCGVCRRYGAAWAYYITDEVHIKWKEGASTRQYIWGDRLCEFHFCDHCGGMMYWWPTSKANSKEMGVNTNMAEPEQFLRIERRRTFVEG